MAIDSMVMIMFVLLALLLVAVLATVVVRNLLGSAILLAVTSTVVALILFVLEMKLAAVMELAVCAGLVTAIYASAISLSKPEQDEKRNVKAENRAWILRHLALPLILIALAVLVVFLVPQVPIDFGTAADAAGGAAGAASPTVQTVLWDLRMVDILSLALLILAGVLGVAALIGKREEK
ncbi:MAG: hypothetical protein FWD45_02550 [Coriobacteriia bacterium]|nr:hypothetical protein [Coriobacteriia bacterium]